MVLDRAPVAPEERFASFLVEIGAVGGIVGIGLRDRRRGRRFQRRLALGQLGLLALLLVGHVVQGHLGLGLVLAVVLGLLGIGLGVGVVLVLLAGAVGIGLVLGILLGLVLLVLVGGVRILAQLVAIAQIRDDLARETSEIGLVREPVLQILQRSPGLVLDEPAPQVHHVLRALGHVAPGGQVPDQVARRHRKRRIRALGDLLIAAPRRVMADLGVDVAGGTGHVARAHRLAAGGLHRLVEIARHVPGRGIAGMDLLAVILAVHRQRIGGAARQQHLVAGHPPADLRQAHGLARQARGIDRIADRQLGIVGQHLGGLGQRLLERIGGVV